MRYFDLHCDTLYECWKAQDDLFQNMHHVDVRRGSRYTGWTQVLAVWLPDTLQGEEARTACRAVLEFAHRQEKEHPELLHIVRQGKELEKEERWPCRAILGIEGGGMLGGRLDSIEEFAELGVKVITLTWNGSNELGHGCGSGCSDGLTAFGKEAVRRMEGAGIVPDVSHLNERGFWDVLETAHRPVIASHSVSAAVHEHPRNLTDAQFDALVQQGGLVGLNLCAAQLGRQSFECLERHLYHYLSRSGERTVAFGCDFDGTDIPAEWGGIQMMEGLYAYFLRRNYSSDCLERLFFKNAREFFVKALTSPWPID